MSKRSLQITFIANRSIEGQELCKQFKALAEIQGHSVNTPEASLYEAIRVLSSKDDLVVIDATREENSAEHNYHMISPASSVHSHILLVSRNYLPLNVSCQNDTIADTDSNTIYENAPRYRGVLSNKKILHFLNLQIKYAEGLSPRKSFSALGHLASGFIKMVSGQFETNEQDAQRQHSGQVFISFRHADSEKVGVLRRRIEAKRSNEFFPGGKSVRFFAPGSLSDEIFTEWRRWNVLSWLDRFIGPADEFWIYKSTTDNGKYYFNSWWTLGEIMTVAYRRYSGYKGKTMWRVRLYDEATDTVHDLSENFFPKLSEEQEKRLVRWYANADSIGLSAEYLIRAAKMAQWQYMPSLGKAYVKDHVFSNEFWTDYILDCPCCRTIGNNESHFDIDNWLWHKEPSFTRLSQQVMQRAIASDRVVRCGNKDCHAVFYVENGESHYLQLRPDSNEEEIRSLRDFFHDTSNDRYLLRLPSYKLIPTY